MPLLKPSNEAILAALPYALALLQEQKDEDAVESAPPPPSKLSCADFTRDILGHDNWHIPFEIMASVAKPRSRTAVKSCHASAKTFTAAEIMLWWVYEVGGICISTAPTDKQLTLELWAEFRKAYDSSKIPLGGQLLPKANEWYFGPSQFAVGWTASTGINFHGLHGDKVLVIIDEATGVPSDIWNAIEGIRAGGDVRILAFANPIISSGNFFDAFTSQRGSWNTYTIDAFDTPNMIGTLPKPIAQMTDDELIAAVEGWDEEYIERNPRPYLITRAYVQEKLRDWGIQSPLWQTKVRGRFPQQSNDALIWLEWLDNCRIPLLPLTDASEVCGIDVAGAGDDETVIVVYKGNTHIDTVAYSDPDPRGKVTLYLKEHPKIRRINIDSAGIGWNFFLHIRDQFPDRLVVPINVGEKASTPQAEERFADLKAELYWNLRKDFQTSRVSGITDDITVGQLAGILYFERSDGRIEIESKVKARKRGVKSPDRAEAHMLARARINPNIMGILAQGAASGWSPKK